jgi:hypothetical protein
MIRLTQGVGQFRAVLFVSGLNEAAAVSTVFNVAADEKVLTVDRSSYFLGQLLNVSYSSTNKIPFHYTDQICIFNENVTDYGYYTYYYYYCTQLNLLSSLGYLNETQGSLPIQLNQGVGRFKAVLFIGSTTNNAAGVSSVFEVIAEEKVLTLDKSSYFLGETSIVSFSSPNNIPFQYYDRICIFTANITIFTSYGCVQSYFLSGNGYGYWYGNETKGNILIQLTQGVGKFKAVLFVSERSEAAAISNIFDVTLRSTTNTTKSPTMVPTRLPTKAPMNTPSKAPSPPSAATNTPSNVPVNRPTVMMPTQDPTTMPQAPPTGCGLFGFSIFCPRRGKCGFFRRLFNIQGCR